MHGDVFNVHTEVFSACHNTTQYTQHNTIHTPTRTTHNTHTTHKPSRTHTTTHGDRQTDKVDRS